MVNTLENQRPQAGNLEQPQFAKLTPELRNTFIIRLPLLKTRHSPVLDHIDAKQKDDVSIKEFDGLGRLARVTSLANNLTITLTYTKTGYIESITSKSKKRVQRESYAYRQRGLGKIFPVAVRVQDLDPKTMEPKDDGALYDLEKIIDNDTPPITE